MKQTGPVILTDDLISDMPALTFKSGND